MPRALLSVSDKTGLQEFATSLVEMGWDLVASGGTRRILLDANLPVTPIDDLTGVPALLGGRVKTLHPAIHAGILARDTENDINDLTAYGYAPFKLVVCNLYPFRETVNQQGTTLQDGLAQIDIGGATLLRAAAKNFFYVVVVSDSGDYPRVISALRASGDVELALRRSLAIKAFAYIRDYDTAIHAYLSHDSTTTMTAVTNELPRQLSIGVKQSEDLRYGENAHQMAAYYGTRSGEGPLGGTLLGGGQLSYNNILDSDAAWRAVGSFSDPAIVIVKHLSPTGVALSDDIRQAYQDALASDPMSAFGGVIAANRQIGLDFVQELGSIFVEVIVAPEFTPEAIERLREKRKNCRLLQISRSFDGSELEIRSVHRGILVQRGDMGDPENTSLKVVTSRQPTSEEMATLQFAWKAVQHVKSNAIVLAKSWRTVGIGGGLPSRVDAVRLAITKAGDEANDAVLASDAFFPFADGIEEAVSAGVRAIIQPGGSIRDQEVIDVANAANIAMVVTGTRHFRH